MIAALALTLALAAPPAPQTDAGIDCAWLHMTPEGREVTGALAVLPPDDSLLEPARAAGLAAVARCAPAVRNDPLRYDLVNTYAAERAVVEYSNAALVEQGMSDDAVEALYERLPGPTRAAIATFVREGGDLPMKELIAWLGANGVALTYESLKPAISGLCALVSMRSAEAAWPK